MQREVIGRDEGQGREQRRRATKDGASTDVPIAPRDASDGRVSGLVKRKNDSSDPLRHPLNSHVPFHYCFFLHDVFHFLLFSNSKTALTTV